MVTKIDADKRIWIGGVRFDDLIDPEFLNEERGDDEWKVISVEGKATRSFDVITPSGDYAGFTIRTNFNRKIVSTGVGFRIDLDDETLMILDDNGDILCGIGIRDTYVVMTHAPIDAGKFQYDILIEVFDVPYDIMSRNISQAFNAVNFPIAWTVYSPINEREFIVVALNSVDPPNTMLFINREVDEYDERRLRDTLRECLVKLYSIFLDRFGKFPYGISENSIVMLDVSPASKASLLETESVGIKPYIVGNINGCPRGDGIIELTPLKESPDSNSKVTMRFDDFFFKYRGVFSVRSAIIIGTKIFICIDGVIISRDITKELMSMIDALINSSRVHEHMDDNLSDAVKDYILQNYSSKSMIDQVVICNDKRGVISCNIKHDDMALANNPREVNNE